MKLEYPLSISSRLLPAVRFNTFTVSLDVETWEYFIDFHGEATGTETIRGSDFTPSPLVYGMSDSEAVRHALGAMLSFLSAYVEAVQYDGDNVDLFPYRLAQWAEREADEISLAQWELDND